MLQSLKELYSSILAVHPCRAWVQERKEVLLLLLLRSLSHPPPHLETLALIWAKLPGPLPLSHRPGILISVMFPAYLQTNREKHRLINRWENRDSVAHSSIHSFHPFIHLIYSFISHHNKRIKGKSTGALLLSLPQEESFPNFLVFPTHLLKNIFILTR